MDNTPQDETPDTGAIDGTVRFLKILVTTLTATTIIGLIVVITVIVMRFQQESALPLPENITLPEGVSATAITRGAGWLAIVTNDDRILIMGLDGKTVYQDITITPAN